DQVHVDDTREIGKLHRAFAPDDTLCGRNACAIHEDARGAVLFARFGHRFRRGIRIRHVAFQRERADLRGDRSHRLRIHVEERDFRARIRKRRRRRGAKTRSSAGDERRLSFVGNSISQMRSGSKYFWLAIEFRRDKLGITYTDDPSPRLQLKLLCYFVSGSRQEDRRLNKKQTGRSQMKRFKRKTTLFATALLGASIAALTLPAQAWEPTKPIEIIVPAGTGGGADQMARAVQGIITKHNLSKQSVVVINKSGGAGGEGFLDVKNSKGDDHKLIITLSNLFTTPLATGIPFSYKDLTPIAMMALDEFVLWVNASTPYQTAKDYMDAIKKAPDGQFKMGGTGSKQEDQIITVAIEKVIGKKMTYIPYKGGGAVAVQLVGGHVDSTVNNPIEAVAQWRAGSL